VRLFIGSGMPRGLWRRVQRRFAPARVVEFYASAETGAILINLRDAKPGAMGRPLPGSPEVRLAAYDIEAGELVLGADGFVAECGPDEVGMLLARSREASGTATLSLRGVFHRDDAWLGTGDLFRRDSDGDFWRLDSVRELIHSASGPVFTAPIRDALGDLPAVDIAVAYGVPGPKGHDLAVAAVTLRPEYQLDAAELTAALAVLPRAQRPTVVRVVDEIPVTTWYRPITGPLREEGIPAAGDERPAWHRGPRADGYKSLTAADRKGLMAS
jgi:putative long chain acyl-CoA synthase